MYQFGPLAFNNSRMLHTRLSDTPHLRPFDLLITQAATRGMLKTGSVAVKIEPVGRDAWRFNFFLDLLFEDAAHLIAWANGLEVTRSRPEQSFGIE